MVRQSLFASWVALRKLKIARIPLPSGCAHARSMFLLRLNMKYSFEFIGKWRWMGRSTRTRRELENESKTTTTKKHCQTVYAYDDSKVPYESKWRDTKKKKSQLIISFTDGSDGGSDGGSGGGSMNIIFRFQMSSCLFRIFSRVSHAPLTPLVNCEVECSPATHARNECKMRKSWFVSTT